MDEEEFEDELLVSRFEQMLKTNEIYYFEADEFEIIANYYFCEGKIALTKKCIKYGLEQHPNCLGIYVIHLELLMFQNEYERAEKEIFELLETYEDHNEFLFLLFDIYKKLNREEEAKKIYDRLIRVYPFSRIIEERTGIKFLENNTEEEYIKYLETNATDLINDESSVIKLCEIFYKFYKTPSAIKLLNNFINKFPYTYRIWIELGNAQKRSRKYHEALKAYEYATLIDEDNVTSYCERAKILQILKRFEEAIDLYEIVLQKIDTDPYIYSEIGKCYYHIKQHDKALYYFYKAVKEDPQLSKGWYNLAKFYYKKSDYDKANKYIFKAIENDFLTLINWKLNRKINLKLGNFEIVQFSNNNIEDIKNSKEFNFTKQWVQFHVFYDEYETIIDKLKNESSENYTEVEYFFYVGLLELLRNNLKEGAINITKAYKLDPSILNKTKEYLPEALYKIDNLNDIYDSIRYNA